MRPGLVKVTSGLPALTSSLLALETGRAASACLLWLHRQHAPCIYRLLCGPVMYSDSEKKLEQEHDVLALKDISKGIRAQKQ